MKFVDFISVFIIAFVVGLIVGLHAEECPQGVVSRVISEKGPECGKTGFLDNGCLEIKRVVTY